VPESLPPRYTDVRLLGEGSFAAVYAARDAVLGRPVAVKVLHGELLADVPARQRFAREARLAALVGMHPNVVTLHDAGEWRGRPFLVLELLEGTLAERLRETVSESLALRWLAQAAAALDFVHAAGVVHRDVKPANLLLDRRGDIRLGDFGVARGETLERLTAPGGAVGTPGYLAPEAAAGGAIAASDLYSLAVIARELLGDRPALERALASAPGERFPSGAALVAALGAGEETTRVRSPVARKVERLPHTVRAHAAAYVPRRHRAIRRGAGVAGVAAIAAAAAAGGALLGLHFADTGLARDAVAPPKQTCALSTFRHDVNVVLHGAGAAKLCRAQAHALQLQGERWSYRAGSELFAPDHGSDSVGVVCTLERRAIRLKVYDSGGRRLGSDLCSWYAEAGWHAAARA
jgi:Protein kinase domain